MLRLDVAAENFTRAALSTGGGPKANSHQFVAEPERFLVASAATSVASFIGTAIRDGNRCYYIDKQS